jgi:hypothetical protein
VKLSIRTALLCAVLMAFVTAIGGPLVGFFDLSPIESMWLLLSGPIFAVPLFVGPYLAGRMGWLSSPLPAKWTLLAVLPMIVLPGVVAAGLLFGEFPSWFILEMLHSAHRGVPGRIWDAMTSADFGVAGGVGAGVVLWICVSLLTRRWRGQMLATICFSFGILVGVLVFIDSVLHVGHVLDVGLGLAVPTAAGFLYGLAISWNDSLPTVERCFRFAVSSFLLAIAGCGSVLLATSFQEQEFPVLPGGPLWSLDLASTGCSPEWRFVDPSAAAQKIAFAGNLTLGMALESVEFPIPDNMQKNTTCILTVDAKSGKLISKLVVDGKATKIVGNKDGSFQVEQSEVWTTYTAELERVGPPKGGEVSAEQWTNAHWRNFRSDESGKLWFEERGVTKLLAKFDSESVLIYPLGAERVLVIGGREFRLFRTDGGRVSGEQYTQDYLHFAAVSGDGSRFAISSPVVGNFLSACIPDERILVFDSKNGTAITSFRIVHMGFPQLPSVLSADGSFLAIGAQSSLRLYRLPQKVQN